MTSESIDSVLDPIYEHERGTGQKVTCIVMHPKKYQEIWRGLTWEGAQTGNYMGLPEIPENYNEPVLVGIIGGVELWAWHGMRGIHIVLMDTAPEEHMLLLDYERLNVLSAYELLLRTLVKRARKEERVQAYDAMCAFTELYHAQDRREVSE